jgi:hypothetical protein
MKWRSVGFVGQQMQRVDISANSNFRRRSPKGKSDSLLHDTSDWRTEGCFEVLKFF